MNKKAEILLIQAFRNYTGSSKSQLGRDVEDAFTKRVEQLFDDHNLEIKLKEDEHVMTRKQLRDIYDSGWLFAHSAGGHLVAEADLNFEQIFKKIRESYIRL